MKKTLFILSLLGSTVVFGQEKRVGINTDTPRATLEINKIIELPEETPQGVRFPKFSTEQRDKFRNMKEGLMIYNISLKCLEIYVNKSWVCINKH